jgi:hypothetical protein
VVVDQGALEVPVGLAVRVALVTLVPLVVGVAPLDPPLRLQPGPVRVPAVWADVRLQQTQAAQPAHPRPHQCL